MDAVTKKKVKFVLGLLGSMAFYFVINMLLLTLFGDWGLIGVVLIMLTVMGLTMYQEWYEKHKWTLEDEIVTRKIMLDPERWERWQQSKREGCRPVVLIHCKFLGIRFGVQARMWYAPFIAEHFHEVKQ